MKVNHELLTSYALVSFRWYSVGRKRIPLSGMKMRDPMIPYSNIPNKVKFS